MFRARRRLVLSMLMAIASCLLVIDHGRTVAAGEPTEWKAGAAAVKITPEKMMWMAGYAARKKPAEGVAQDLFAKALVVEDAKGQRLVIVTFDLVGIPRLLRDQLAVELASAHQVRPEWLLLNASHTHCGPEIKGLDDAT
jgi:hypothetical protein